MKTRHSEQWTNCQGRSRSERKRILPHSEPVLPLPNFPSSYMITQSRGRALGSHQFVKLLSTLAQCQMFITACIDILHRPYNELENRLCVKPAGLKYNLPTMLIQKKSAPVPDMHRKTKPSTVTDVDSALHHTCSEFLATWAYSFSNHSYQF